MNAQSLIISINPFFYPPHPNLTNTLIGCMSQPRREMHFNPKNVNAAIVTCGGLCPGLNNVVREITNALVHLYGIGGKIYGIRGGYNGFVDEVQYPPIELTPEVVENIHHRGGTILSSSRGGFDLQKILAFLKKRKINQLYVIGGDGTHRGAFRIHEGCMDAGMNVAVAGIPKTIDVRVLFASCPSCVRFFIAPSSSS
jgi:6-phosphofructokinase 1